MIKHLLLSIFLLLPTLAFTQTQELLTIQNDSAEIVLESMDVHVRIMGNIATTVTEMTFHNPNDRVLEGELNFPLAENQRVYRFALDFSGKLREGVAVEKNLGRRAFEGVVRQNIDPALLEMTAGNNYKARIYPIPARGTRKILIGAEEELQYSENPLYQLAMNYGQIGNFHIKVELIDQSFKPRIKRNDLVNFDFEQWNQGFVAEHSASDFKAAGVLSFEIPSKLTDVVYRERQPKTDFFYLIVNPPQINTLKKKPTRVAIIWDASTSAKNRNLVKEKELLSAYFNEFDDVETTILQFSDELHDTAKVRVQNGNSSEVIAILDSAIYDGGTNLEKVDFSQLKFDEIILFSDGISNLGQLVIDEQLPPVYTVCSSGVADLSLLKYLANRTGGSFVNLVNTSLEDAHRQLNMESLQFLGATFNERKIKDVYPSHPTSIDVNSIFTVSGKVRTNKKASLTLKFGIRGQVLETREIQIDNTLLGSSLPRLWAHKRVEELIMEPDNNRDAIIAIGKQYGLVTPHTSLIVLDRVEDYVRYGIVPPAELRVEYDRIVSERKEEHKVRDAEIMEWVLEDFEDRVDWWKDNMKDSTKHVPQENERRPGHDTNTQSGDTDSTDREEVDARSSAVEDQVEEEDSADDTDQESEPSNSPMASDPVDAGDYDKVVTGKITSTEDGSALPGVNVIVKGTQRGTISDIDGNYRIAINNDETLVISFIGYSTNEIEPGSRSVVDISLSEDVQQLSEVVVTAMGVEVNRQSLSYSISTVTTALAGKVAGVSISDTTGGTVVVRGNSAIAMGDEPMYLIDGEQATKSDFEALDLDEVGSMNVIKGENAAALYGSQAADGVIVIMTKDALDEELVLPDSVSSRFEPDLVIADWQPDEPYLDTLMKTKPQNRYTVYLGLKETYATMPSFYLSVGSNFINEGQGQLGMRILSNLAELDLENYELLKMLAHKYRQVGAYKPSIYLFKKIAEIREGEPHSLRDLAITYQANGQYQQALDLFLKILITDWHDDEERFPLIKSTVLGEMNNLISRHEKELDLDKIPKELIISMPVDIRVVLDWNTLETDLDLWVIEPDGEKSYYGNQLTMNGGRLVEDYMDGYGPEEYLLKQAMPGEYRIEVDYFDDRVQKIAGPTTLQVTIYTNYGRKNQQQKSMTLQLKNEEETVQVGTFRWKD